MIEDDRRCHDRARSEPRSNTRRDRLHVMWLVTVLAALAATVTTSCAPAAGSVDEARSRTGAVAPSRDASTSRREVDTTARAEAASTRVPTATSVPFTGEAPEIWMGGGGMRRLAWDDDWACTAASLTGIKLYIGELADADIDDLRALARVVDTYDLQVAVELGGLLSQHVGAGDRLGETTFADEFARVRRFTDPVDQGGAGGTVHVLEFDGPIRRAVWPPAEVRPSTPIDVATASRELADAMAAWVEVLPDVRMHLLVNLPNWGWRGAPAYQRRDDAAGTLGWGNYAQVLPRVVADARARRLPLVRLTVDHPFDYASGLVRSNQPQEAGTVDWWNRAFEVLDAGRSLGLSTALIVNEARGGNTSDEAFSAGSLAYLESLLASDQEASSRGQPSTMPDATVVQSWYRYPRTMTPDSLEHSLTHLTLQFALRLGAAPDGCEDVGSGR